MSAKRSQTVPQTVHITLAVAARQIGLSARTVRRFTRCGPVGEPLVEADLAELRRARRITELGINLAGVGVILRMRRRVEALQARMAALGMDMRSFSGLPEMPEVWMLISPNGWEKRSRDE